MKGIEVYNLKRLCRKREIDPQEVDSGINYYENLSALSDRFRIEDREARLLREYERHMAARAAHRGTGVYRKGAICPKCGVLGSGLHVKWVLNEQKRKYQPYYSFAHSVKDDRRYRVKWCYIPLAQAVKILEEASD
jgi:hypothetical protein